MLCFGKNNLTKGCLEGVKCIRNSLCSCFERNSDEEGTHHGLHGPSHFCPGPFLHMNISQLNFMTGVVKA